MPTTAAPTWVSNTLWAHRGLHGPGTPENSRAAFGQAIAAGYGIELDVRLLADGELAVVHDADLSRLCGQPLAVRALSSRQIQEFQLLNTIETIPLLPQVLALVAGQVPLLIELKSWAWPGAAEAQLLAQLAGYTGPVAVQSFNPLTVGWLARQAPHLCRGQLAGRLLDEGLNRLTATLMRWAMLSGYGRPHFLGYEAAGLPSAAVARHRAAGRPVLAWTVRDTAEQARMQSLADAIIFEGFEP